MSEESSSRKPRDPEQKGIMAQADLRRVERACKHVIAARQELENAIRDAVASGETYRDVAARAGMSHQRVQQIVAKQQAE